MCTLPILLSLLGSALLGYLLSWFMRQSRMQELTKANDRINSEFERSKAAYSRSVTELDTLRISFDDLKKRKDNLETNNFVLSGQLKEFQVEKENMSAEIAALALKADTPEIKEVIKEIEITKEIPVIAAIDLAMVIGAFLFMMLKSMPSKIKSTPPIENRNRNAKNA